MSEQETTTPITETPPVETPPVETPPVETPPVETPPVETPEPSTNMLVGLSEELLKNERLSGVESVEELAQRLVDANLAQDTPAPDGYTLPDGVSPEIGQFAHDNKLSQEQLDSVMGKMITHGNEMETTRLSTLAEEGQAKLTEWGDTADDNVALASAAVTYLETKHEGLRQRLNETGMGNDPMVMEVFKEVGHMIKEGGFVASDVFTPASNKTPAQRMFPSQK